MPPQQLRLVAPHNNQRLFSDYYLNETLPQHPLWRALIPAAERTLHELSGIFAAYSPSANEAQTERDLVRPVLEALGHTTFEVQVALKTPDGAKTPDYVFYRSAAFRQANKGVVVSDEQLRSAAYAVGDAKYWDRKLDVALNVAGGDPFNNRNPSYQIAFYIQHSGVAWGILTNGRLWRLYNQATAHKLDRFYEVDLPALLELGDPASLLYFFLFFRREAFDPGGLSLAEILKGSADYARGVSDKLKLQVFDALRHLAQGFLDYPANRLQPTEETLSAVYDNALILLYRLLFILYAEARELLPVRGSRDYRESYSLYALTHRIAENLRYGSGLLPTTAMTWQWLVELFQIIDAGSPPLRVATFNGGLFDPERHPFLVQNRVGDAHLQQAIDILARVDGEFVDYRDLAEFHLGSIYEGLLEYHLAASEPEEGWTVALVNEKGERKRTGSYYTPNYIVKYIVEHTLGPRLQAAIAQQADDQARVDAVLRVNVVDPAMGSGYFLVEATEFIARFLVDHTLAPVAGDGDEPDLAHWKRRVVQSCIYGVDINPLAVDLAKLSLWLSTIAKDRPLSFLDHHLRVGNSVVGARIRDLQQVDAMPKPKKQARKASAPQQHVQIPLLDDDMFRQSMSTAVDSMWRVERSAGNTVDEVKQQERVYAELHDTLTRRYGRLADLVTATNFGVEVDPQLWTPLADYATGRALATLPKLADALRRAEDLAEEQHFFHWELEFPEVFFNRFGEPRGELSGFDAVIGNPPYVRQERLKTLKSYLATHFASYYSVADLYIYFYEQGLSLLHAYGRLGYISSGTFAHGNFAKSFRNLLPSTAQLETVINFGENQPFEGAEMVHPTIMILEKHQQQFPFRYLFVDGKIPSSLDSAVAERAIECDASSLRAPEWTFQPVTAARLAERVLNTGRPLGETVEGRIYYGIKTGLNEAFVVDRATKDAFVAGDPASATMIKPMVHGQDLRPWYQEDEGRWLIVLPAGWTRQEFGPTVSDGDAWNLLVRRHPLIADHLRAFESAGRSRQDQGDFWWELRPCDYYSAFETPKIMWPDIAKLPRFSWDDTGKYMSNTGYIIPGAHPSLLAILQSRLLWFTISQVCQPLRLRAGLWQYRLIRQFMTRLPIPELTERDSEILGSLAIEITSLACQRYSLDTSVRRRVLSDLSTHGHGLNQRLTTWWELDFPEFRVEIQKALKRDIPLRERDDWDQWLDERRAEHERYTTEIVALETRLNEYVYALFDLSPAEITTIDASTKYSYGEV